MASDENWLDACMDLCPITYSLPHFSSEHSCVFLSMYTVLYLCGLQQVLGTLCLGGLLHICGDPHPLHPLTLLGHMKNVPLHAYAMGLITVS